MKCRRIKIKNDVRMVIRRLNKKLVDLGLKGPIAISLVEYKMRKRETKTDSILSRISLRRKDRK